MEDVTQPGDRTPEPDRPADLIEAALLRVEWWVIGIAVPAALLCGLPLMAVVAVVATLEIARKIRGSERPPEPAGRRLPGVLFTATAMAVATMDARFSSHVWTAWLALWLVAHHDAARHPWSAFGRRLALATAIGACGLFGAMSATWVQSEGGPGPGRAIAGWPQDCVFAELATPADATAHTDAGPRQAREWRFGRGFLPVRLAARHPGGTRRTPIVGGYCLWSFLVFAGFGFLASLTIPCTSLPRWNRITRWLVLAAWWLGPGRITVVYPS